MKKMDYRLEKTLVHILKCNLSKVEETENNIICTIKYQGKPVGKLTANSTSVSIDMEIEGYELNNTRIKSAESKKSEKKARVAEHDSYTFIPENLEKRIITIDISRGTNLEYCIKMGNEQFGVGKESFMLRYSDICENKVSDISIFYIGKDPVYANVPRYYYSKATMGLGIYAQSSEMYSAWVDAKSGRTFSKEQTERGRNLPAFWEANKSIDECIYEHAKGLIDFSIFLPNFRNGLPKFMRALADKELLENHNFGPFNWEISTLEPYNANAYLDASKGYYITTDSSDRVSTTPKRFMFGRPDDMIISRATELKGDKIQREEIVVAPVAQEKTQEPEKIEEIPVSTEIAKVQTKTEEPEAEKQEKIEETPVSTEVTQELEKKEEPEAEKQETIEEIKLPVGIKLNSTEELIKKLATAKRNTKVRLKRKGYEGKKASIPTSKKESKTESYYYEITDETGISYLNVTLSDEVSLSLEKDGIRLLSLKIANNNLSYSVTDEVKDNYIETLVDYKSGAEPSYLYQVTTTAKSDINKKIVAAISLKQLDENNSLVRTSNSLHNTSAEEPFAITVDKYVSNVEEKESSFRHFKAILKKRIPFGAHIADELLDNYFLTSRDLSVFIKKRDRKEK